MPREVEGRNIYLCSPDYMAEYAKRFIQSGVKVIGGCCGTNPAHIKAMKAAVKAHQPPRRAITAPLRPAATATVSVVPCARSRRSGRSSLTVSS